MSYFSRLQIKMFQQYLFKTGLDPENSNLHLKHVNLIIGPNNSGKSKFAREIFKFNKNDINFELNEYPLTDIKINVSLILEKTSQTVGNTVTQLRTYNNQINLENLEQFVSIDYFTLTHLQTLKNLINALSAIFNYGLQANIDIHAAGRIINSRRYPSANNIISLCSETVTQITNLEVEYNKIRDFYYIPSLRGLRYLNSIESEDLYLDTTKNDYFNNLTASSKKIVSGLEFYEQLDSLLRGTHKERKLVADYENFLSKNFFSNLEVNLIPRKNKKIVYVKIGEENEFPIHEYGDGLQSIIINTYSIFFANSPSVFIFEEPDLFMHPSMQRRFIESLYQEEFKQHQFFLTTHSNHMLDIAQEYGDISILKASAEGRDFIITDINEDMRSILSVLGVRNSSVLISNTTFWVEGIADRLYIKYWFKKYLESINENSFKEDIHYCFVEYGGANLPHFTFDRDSINLNSLAPNSFFILDGDVVTSKPEWPTQLNEADVKNIILECKEIECLIDQEAFKVIIDEDKHPIFDYGNEYLEPEGLAHHLLRKAEELNIPLNGVFFLTNTPFSDLRGTLTFDKKAELARRLTTKSELQLTPKVIELCESILQFIRETN